MRRAAARSKAGRSFSLAMRSAPEAAQTCHASRPATGAHTPKFSHARITLTSSAKICPPSSMLATARKLSSRSSFAVAGPAKPAKGTVSSVTRYGSKNSSLPYQRVRRGTTETPRATSTSEKERINVVAVLYVRSSGSNSVRIR